MKALLNLAARSALAVCIIFTMKVEPLHAQTTPAPSAQSSDHAALRYAIDDSVSEIAVCRLALTKTSNDAVRTFANRMISDHTAIESDTEAVAQRMGEKPSMSPTTEGPIVLAYLSSFNGKRFDDEFLRAQVDDHTNDITTLRNALQATQSDQMKTWLLRTLAKLDDHLRLANDTLDEVSR